MERVLEELCIGFLFLSVGALFFYTWLGYYNRKRATDFQKIAAQLSLSWRGGDDRALRERLKVFTLFRRGSGQKIGNTLVGQIGGRTVTVLEYSHSHVTNNVVYRYIVLALDLATPCPPLVLRPAELLDSRKHTVQPLPAAQYPRLGGKYVLEGELPATLFPRLLGFWEQLVQVREEPVLECSSHQMLYYHRLPNGPVDSEVVRGLLNDGLVIADTLIPNQP